jgi:GT2 family glycosyltransferase
LRDLPARDAVQFPLSANSSIASVTVAYNGAAVLRRHLDSLRKQTRKLDEIVVVDNGSTDDTTNLIMTEYRGVTVLDQRENKGVGGGLASGLSYAALNGKHDWVWLFDQDSVPEPDALERLLGAFQQLEPCAQRIGILASWCVHSETGMTFPGLCWYGAKLLPAPSPQENISFSDSVITAGTLIHREALKVVGLPRADFFIDFVDHEHCFRLRRHGFSIAVIRDSVLEHTIGEPRKINILGWTKFWTDHAPWREYYMTRNLVFTIWHEYPQAKAFVRYCLVKRVVGMLLFGQRKLACLSMMWRGFLDGRAGRLGVRFLPHEREGHREQPTRVEDEAYAGRIS